MEISKEGNKFLFARIRLSTTLADDTAITADNVKTLFTIESNANVEVSLFTNTITFSVAQMAFGDPAAWIYSEKVNGSWIHSDAVLNGTLTKTYTAEVALPTYPTGAARFLNGGEL